jgi:hypothetical protein
MALPVMKAALSTLALATTRARRSEPAQACTAAKTARCKGRPNREPSKIERDVEPGQAVKALNPQA